MSLRKYLLSKIKKSNGCWNWSLRPNGSGYGEAPWKGKYFRAHRLSYLAFVGPIPKGKIVRHTCDNRMCINPKHLVVGTKKDNRADFMKRHPRAMELCTAAAKIAGKGLKRFWENMSPKQRRAFCKNRARKFAKKYPKNHPMYARRAAAIRISKQ